MLIRHIFDGEILHHHIPVAVYREVSPTPSAGMDDFLCSRAFAHPVQVTLVQP